MMHGQKNIKLHPNLLDWYNKCTELRSQFVINAHLSKYVFKDDLNFNVLIIFHRADWMVTDELGRNILCPELINIGN